MDKILYFDYCALILLGSTLCILLHRKLAYGINNFTYTLLICGMLLTTVFDIGMEHMIKYMTMTKLKLFLFYFFAYGYFLLRNASNLIYIIFILVVTRPVLKLKKYAHDRMIYLPYILIVALFVSNVFTGKVFTFDVQNGYSRGPLLIIAYILSFVYALIGVLYLLKGWKYIGHDLLLIMIIQYPICFLAVGIQFFYPNFLVEMFAMSISVLAVLLLVLKPEDTIAHELGIQNYHAFRTEMKKYHHTKDSVDILIVRFTNSYQVRAYLGEGKFNKYVTAIARHLDNRFKAHKQRFNIYFDQAGCFYVTIDPQNFDIEKVAQTELDILRKQLRDFSVYGLRFDYKICSIKFPSDVDDVESFFHFSAVFPKIMPQDIIFTPARDLVQTKDFQIRNNITKILDRAIHEQNLEMYYQPIYSIKDGSFKSAEALIRLKDPVFGFVPPSVFIPAAEQSSFMQDIGDFIIKEVFRFISGNDLKKLGLEYIEVNLSVTQCIQRNMSEKIIRMQEVFGIDPKTVNFEITESAYNNSAEIMDENISSLSQAGYSLSLDDYGTGYSNMQRILNIPLSIIKIDKSLVDNMETEKGLSIVKNTISMMHDIDMRLVVEGVETKEILEKLKEMGADYIQGFHFSKPLCEKDFLEFLRKNNRQPSDK